MGFIMCLMGQKMSDGSGPSSEEGRQLAQKFVGSSSALINFCQLLSSREFKK